MGTSLAIESISLSIATLRGQRVIMDSDLAALYGVETKRFNEAIKRNAARFPADFMLQLTAEDNQWSWPAPSIFSEKRRSRRLRSLIIDLAR